MIFKLRDHQFNYKEGGGLLFFWGMGNSVSKFDRVMGFFGEKNILSANLMDIFFLSLISDMGRLNILKAFKA